MIFNLYLKLLSTDVYLILSFDLKMDHDLFLWNVLVPYAMNLTVTLWFDVWCLILALWSSIRCSLLTLWSNIGIRVMRIWNWWCSLNALRLVNDENVWMTSQRGDGYICDTLWCMPYGLWNDLFEEKMNFQRISLRTNCCGFQMFKIVRCSEIFSDLKRIFLSIVLCLQAKFQVYDLCVVFMKTYFNEMCWRNPTH